MCLQIDRPGHSATAATATTAGATAGATFATVTAAATALAATTTLTAAASVGARLGVGPLGTLRKLVSQLAQLGILFGGQLAGVGGQASQREGHGAQDAGHKGQPLFLVVDACGGGWVVVVGGWVGCVCVC